jgi:hypothetical protein
LLNLSTDFTHYIDDLFVFQNPFNAKWCWNTIISLHDSCIELLTECKRKKDGIVVDVLFRGEIMILDPSKDHGVIEHCVMLLLSPAVNNLEELEKLEMKLTDFSIHSFQRDVIILGEHMKAEQLEGIKLDVLSKKLEEE